MKEIFNMISKVLSFSFPIPIEFSTGYCMNLSVLGIFIFFFFFCTIVFIIKKFFK